jgi:hypothetical protein
MSLPGRFVHGDEMGLGPLTNVPFSQDELGRVHVLNGSFPERKRAWDSLVGCMESFAKSVYIIGLGA